MEQVAINHTAQHGPEDLSFETHPDRGRGEVRRTDRTVTLLMLGRLSWRGIDTICRIRNVSPGGMCIQTVSSLEEGEHVSIEARSSVCIEGRIAWTNERASGIAFMRDVDHETLIAPPKGPSGARLVARSPRFEACVTARLDFDGRSIKARVVNISMGGCFVESDAAIPSEKEIRLTLPGLATLGCTNRSGNGTRAGLVFVNKPAFANFARWLENPELRFAAASDA